jgi:hypothetical protein
MHLAFLTPLLPTGNPDTGFEIATGCALSALKEAGCIVTLFGFLRADESGEPPAGSVILDRIMIENAQAGFVQKARWLMASHRLNLPVIAAKLATFQPERLHAAMAAHGPFDGYVINGAPMAAAFPALMAEKPSLLIAHNVEHRSAAENAAAAPFPTNILYRREAALLHEAELHALEAAAFVLCLAEEDRTGFGIDISKKSTVLPLLTPARESLPIVEPVQDVGLIGTWTWQPNLVGLRWFLDQVMPLLPADVTVAIAGRTPADIKPPTPAVRLLGRVGDATAFLAQSRTIALTSRNGTGIQLKTIETFQTGKPAVATRSSIRGLAQLPANCLVADEAAGFAAALTKLVRDVRSERTGIADGQGFILEQLRGQKQAINTALRALRR